jgi:hypothetical protein
MRPTVKWHRSNHVRILLMRAIALEVFFAAIGAALALLVNPRQR